MHIISFVTLKQPCEIGQVDINLTMLQIKTQRLSKTKEFLLSVKVTASHCQRELGSIF